MLGHMIIPDCSSELDCYSKLNNSTKKLQIDENYALPIDIGEVILSPGMRTDG